MRIARRYTALFTKGTYLYDLTSDTAFATVATAPTRAAGKHGLRIIICHSIVLLFLLGEYILVSACLVRAVSSAAPLINMGA